MSSYNSCFDISFNFFWRRTSIGIGWTTRERLLPRLDYDFNLPDKAQTFTLDFLGFYVNWIVSPINNSVFNKKAL